MVVKFYFYCKLFKTRYFNFYLTISNSNKEETLPNTDYSIDNGFDKIVHLNRVYLRDEIHD